MMSDNSKHVEKPRNKGIINLSYTVASCWSFYKNRPGLLCYRQILLSCWITVSLVSSVT